jgi:hypothetical protein
MLFYAHIKTKNVIRNDKVCFIFKYCLEAQTSTDALLF